MATWKPEIPVQSFMPLELNRGNPVRYIYELPARRVFPDAAVVVMTLSDAAGVPLDAWTATVTGGRALFSETVETGNAIPNGSAWTVTATMGADEPQLLIQGIVNRVEAPEFPPTINPDRALSFDFTFDTPGLFISPNWVILSGNPQIYDNSGSSLPNAMACGATLVDGTPTYVNVSMVFHQPLNSDSPRMTYEIVPHGDGDLYIRFATNAGVTESVCTIHHSTSGGTATVAIKPFRPGVTATASVSRTVAHESFSVGYDQFSRTFFVYAATDLTTPLLALSDIAGDSTAMVHSEGFRYFGLVFESAGSGPGIEVANINFADAVTFS